MSTALPEVERRDVLHARDPATGEALGSVIATPAEEIEEVVQAVEHVGLPEARYALAQAAIYLSLAPKSDAAGRALSAATAHVREHGAAPVPAWLRSGPRPGQERGGYENPHRHPGHRASQQLLPEGVAGERFYDPDEAEAQLAARLEEIRAARRRSPR